MKVRAGYLLIMTALSLTACSDKGGSGGGSGPMDIAQFQVESLSDETTLTDSDYAARANSLNVKSKACRKSSFGTLAKGDVFVQNIRAGTMADGKLNTLEATTNTKIVSVGRDIVVSSSVENATSSDVNVEQLLKANSKNIGKCKSGKSGGVACVYSNNTLKGPIEGLLNKYTNCKYSNERNVVRKYSTGNYTLQDGRKVPVIVYRSQGTYDRTCTQGSDTVIASSVKLNTDTLKRSPESECSQKDQGGPYLYSLVQKENFELLTELNVRTLLAPAK